MRLTVPQGRFTRPPAILARDFLDQATLTRLSVSYERTMILHPHEGHVCLSHSHFCFCRHSLHPFGVELTLTTGRACAVNSLSRTMTSIVWCMIPDTYHRQLCRDSSLNERIRKHRQIPLQHIKHCMQSQELYDDIHCIAIVYNGSQRGRKRLTVVVNLPQ